ncbi:hypothetical protein [Paractinoplanes durhamensis]|uniref:DNA replication complex GINS family protein n=1 Tax=Paractinoplanes durhamensis TaxID=113563 RepID=A0ABQ3YVC3_9ACTN|nr:hypothetical protein [Actinoplanes durhamensis]GIE01543.1 hypothetical protein Adu01nite_28930 [Actinoplanes durhamensis]
MFRWFRAIAAAADTRARLLGLPAPAAPPPIVEVPDEAKELAELRDEVANLRTRVLALSGGSDEEDLVHDNLADLYRSLVTQRLRQLARLRWARVRGARPGADGPVAQARMVRELVRLTIAGNADEQDVADWLRGDGDELADPERRAVEGACGQARRLAVGLAGTTRQATFAEDVPRGEPLAEGAGRPWAGCAPDGPVTFVVAPAYLFRGRVLVEPMVFTETEPDLD